MVDNDTIAAISTPLGEGGIGIVRLSGPKSYSITEALFDCPRSSETSYPKARYLYHGYIKDHDGTRVDEVLVTFMPAPSTYTREDVVEINCHSGIFALRAILSLVLKEGARLAEPGEFTKRAFINGRIDLSQAEAVQNIIRARSEEAVKTATRSLQGELKVSIREIMDKIVELRAPLEASFDYPEEFEPGTFDYEAMACELEEVKESIRWLLQGVERDRAYQEGVSVAIIGRPNVGKSSLLNALLRQQRAIVHEVPGTTRDLLEGYMNLGGYPLQLVDTAGIQGTEDPVEQQGVVRSRAAASRARLLIMVVDGSEPWTEADEQIILLRQAEQGMVVAINKSDLEQRVDQDHLEQCYPNIEVVRTAAIQGKGVQKLEEAVRRQLDKVFGPGAESPAIVSLRHEKVLQEALSGVENAIEAVKIRPLELVSLELQNAWLKLGEITGDTASEDLLDKIFSEFCLGK